MNFSLKKKQGKKRALLDDAPLEESKVRKVTQLEAPAATPQKHRLVPLAGASVEYESMPLEMAIDLCADDPTPDDYAKLTVAEFGAALRRGLGFEHEHEADEQAQIYAPSKRGYEGIGYAQHE